MKRTSLAWVAMSLLALIVGTWIGSQTSLPGATAAPNLPTDICPASRFVSGFVRDYQGNLVTSGGTVEILGWPITGTIATTGAYTIDIEGLPITDYMVLATWSTGRAMRLVPASFWADCATKSLDLNLQECLLVGQVRDCVGNPVQGARVEYLGLQTFAGDPHPNPAYTDASGTYTITISSTSPPLPPPPFPHTLVASYLDGLSVRQTFSPECPRKQVNFAGEYCLPNYPCPSGRVLTGGVYDYLGQPVDGATVEIIGWPQTDTTDSSGRYTIDISGLPVSTYTVVATLPTGEVIRKTQGIDFWYGCSQYNLQLDFRQSLLVGYAYDCDGNPVEGAKIEIRDWQTPPGDPYPNPAWTDATGAYTITISALPPDVYTVVARAPNGLTVAQQTFLDGMQGGLTQLNFSGAVCLPTDLCPSQRILTGVVRNYLGQPVEGATVHIRGWQTPPGAPYPNPATTDATGTYTITITGLPISTYSVVASWPHGLAMETKLPDFWQGCLSALPAGNLVLNLEERLLTGYVFDCDGVPIEGATVEFRDFVTLPEDPHPNPATTDANGIYTITVSYPLPLPPDVPTPYQLPNAPYHIVARHKSGASVEQLLAGLQGLVTQLNFTGEFCLPTAPPPTPTPPVQQCGPFTLSGEVWDCRGNPVHGALVEIEGTDRSATTDASGRYVIDLLGLPLQTYSVRVSAAGYTDRVVTPSFEDFWAWCKSTNLVLNFTGESCLAGPPPAVYLPVVNMVAEQAGFRARVEGLQSGQGPQGAVRQGEYETWIQVQNLGNAPTVATLQLWQSYSGLCPPGAPGVFQRLDSGEIPPGSSWTWPASLVHEDARSGVVTASQPIAVQVLRRGPGIPDDTLEVAAAYAGLPDTLLGKRDEAFGGYAYYAPSVYGFHRGLTSWLYIQNAGSKCTSVDIYFRSEESCNRTILGRIPILAPGETYPFDVASVVGGRWQGSAWIGAGQPLAIAVDHVGDNVLMSYIAMPADTLYTGPDANIPFSFGSQVNYGPLVYREYQGWDTTIHVQNLSSTNAAKAKVYFLDASGGVIKTLVDWICPRGSQDFFLPVLNGLPGNYVGAVRVESLDWWSPGDPPVPFPAIVAVAELSKYESPARAMRLEAIAYNLFTEDRAFEWQTGEYGVKLVGIPSLSKKAERLTSEIAIQNVTPLPGFTDLALFVYDPNRLLDFQCEKLHEKQVEYIDLYAWPLVMENFQGSMVISATYWTHQVPNQSGHTTAGIAAVSVLRSGTRLGQDFPGDESAGVEAFPIPLGFKFAGPPGSPPTCPGQ